MNDLFTFTGLLIIMHCKAVMAVYFSQGCKLCQEALNPRDCIFWSATWQLGHLEITAALYVSFGMFPNNSENIYNLRKLHQLLFHFCQQDTLFTQHLNHNSYCKQCPGNLVLTLDWNYVSVQISMHTHYFNSCTQIFQMFLQAFKINITWHTFYHYCCIRHVHVHWLLLYGKGGQSSSQCYCRITNKTICNCLWITTMWLGHTTMILWWKFFRWKLQHSQKNFTKGIIYSVISYG